MFHGMNPRHLARLVTAFLFIALPAGRAADPTPMSPLEAQLAEATKAPGVSVVHFWAPWCPNCKAEMGKEGGWADFIRAHPDTRFLFVTVWNNAEDGRGALEAAGIAGQGNVTVLTDPNPSRGPDKTKAVLGLPVTWIPTTWVYAGGNLRYALNYGEVRFPMLGQMVEDSTASWSHKKP